MTLSARTRLFFALLLLLGAAGYLLLAELAVNAGRVHRGVSVSGFDVGGLNFAEAEAALAERGEQMKVTPLIFVADGFDCRFTPRSIGWGPQEFETAETAMAVGRDGGLLRALGDRVDAWFGGVDVRWADKPEAAKVGREVARCARLGEQMGVTVDKPKLRFLIKRAVQRWPRTPELIPLEL